MRRPIAQALEVHLNWAQRPSMLVGRLAVRNHRVFFEYAPEFLASGLEISPFNLKAAPGVHASDPTLGLPGVFHDSLPDAWGRLLVDRRARQLNIRPEQLTVLDRLACVGARGMGALCYRPVTEFDTTTEAVDLDTLALNARRLIEGQPADVFDTLLALGGSPGGARPKVVVAYRATDQHIRHGALEIPAGYTPLLVKFGAPGDPTDIGPIELAYAHMAQAAGVEMMPCQLLPSKTGPGYFATQRFDRPRVHVHTLAGLLHTDHRLPNLDYDQLLRVTSSLTRDHRQVTAAFRLMSFNVLAHNRDDHGKQFSFIMDHTGQWRLAPAYDLTCADGPGGEHTMTIAGEGAAPGRPHLLELAERARITDATRIISEVEQAVAQWPRWARATGVSGSSLQWVAERIARVQ